MCNKILIFLNDTSLTETFKPVLQKKIMQNTTSTFVFSVAIMILKKLLVLENQPYKRAPEINVDDKLSPNEQELIHYGSGQILFAVIKGYKKFDESGNIEAKNALLFFPSLKCATHEVEAYGFLHFVKKWTNLIDRGRLIKVNDQFFLFIRYVETLVRKTLIFSFTKTYEDEDIFELLQEKLEESSMVNKLWKNMFQISN